MKLTELNHTQYINFGGIYKFKSLIDDRCYIGSTNSFHNRITSHICQLKNNKHHNRYLQAFVNKHGLDFLDLEILKICSFENEDLLCAEQYYIDLYNSHKKGFNLRPNAESNTGMVMSEQGKENIRKGQKNRKKESYAKSIEALKRINTGRKQTVEHIQAVKDSKTKNGTWGFGNKNRQSLTEEQVIKVKTLLKEGYKPMYISKILNIKYDVVDGIKKNKNYKSIQI